MKYSVPEMKIVEFDSENIVTGSEAGFTKAADIDLGKQDYNFGSTPDAQAAASMMAFN